MHSDNETSVKFNLEDPVLANKTKRDDTGNSLTEEERELKRRKLEERQNRFKTSSDVAQIIETKEQKRGSNNRIINLNSEMPSRDGKKNEKRERYNSSRNEKPKQIDLDSEMPPRNPSDKSDSFPRRQNTERRTGESNFERFF